MVSITLLSCEKFLDKKSNKQFVSPEKLEDLQALLDYNTVMNLRSPALGEISADNYYLIQTTFDALPTWDKEAYTWGVEIYTSFPNDWSQTFDVVNYANIVLEQLDKLELTPQNLSAWNNVKGSALLFRSKAFLQASWTWCKSFDSISASSDLGLPLRLDPDHNNISVRSSVKQTYDQVIADLKEAADLLPIIPVHSMRPSKPAAYGLLARTYLSMRLYDSCFKYADLALVLKNELLDFNPPGISNPNATFPIKRFNQEVIMHFIMPNLHQNLVNTRARVDSNLFNSYHANDLRKVVFFRANSDGSRSFKGSFDGSNFQFTGVTTGEIYLMRAECFARKGQIELAMADLNTLLEKRWKLNEFIPLQAATPTEALDIILQERRKELLFRDLRWMDIKRLNKENGNAIILKRYVNNQFLELAPNDNKYALPLPSDVISISKMQQNSR